MSQSVFRRIQKDDKLLRRYTNFEDDRTITKSLMNLAFLPVDQAYAGFCALWDRASDMDEIAADQEGATTDSYVRAELMNERFQRNTYPPSIWNLMERTLKKESQTNSRIRASPEQVESIGKHDLRQFPFIAPARPGICR
ncbi:hypothetical protein L596_030342 [Steinernema carpocapsae]|uniref:Uncharacterized protein n=1 Tax=Steinernema carpocapsae TaxID=34508 RepID=A0A4U5LP36_STECR|nr:hypothetical protein L596_030342 [Steinernema carpocapsae]